MTFVHAAVFGRLREAMQAEVRAVAGGLRRAVAAGAEREARSMSGAVIGGAECPEVAEIGRAAAAPFEDVVDLGVDGETVAAVT